MEFNVRGARSVASTPAGPRLRCCYPGSVPVTPAKSSAVGRCGNVQRIWQKSGVVFT